MSNEHMQFCETISHLTQEEKEWFFSLPSIRHIEWDNYDDDIEITDILEGYGISLSCYDGLESLEDLDNFPNFQIDVYQDNVVLRGDEGFNLDHVAAVVQSFIKKFRPYYVFTLTWGIVSSRPSTNGGGYMVVSYDDVENGNVWRAARLTESKLGSRINLAVPPFKLR